MTPREVLQFARENECTMVDVKFQDLFGTWQHCTRPIQELKEATFEAGYAVDGSRIFGRSPATAADVLVVPDPETARVDPFPREKTLHLLGNLKDATTGERCGRDSRFVAEKAEAYLKSTGVADSATFGAEAQFFLFDDVRFDQTRNSAFYILDSLEGRWNSGRDEQPNLGYKARPKSGQFPCAPVDTLGDVRTEMALELMKVGVEVEVHRHDVATAGQGEIGLRDATLLQQADHLQWLKYVVKNVAYRNGKTATFMPKPLFDDNGSGLKVRQALWKKNQNLFAGDEHGGLSKLALWYIGGLLKHAPALCALCNPVTNSYRRLLPGCDAPVTLAYSSLSPSAAVRVPLHSAGRAEKRIELRTPDPSCNGHLAFSAVLLSGLDGIERRLDPGEPWDGNLPGEFPATPGSLAKALARLEEDHDFLLKGGVFTEGLLRTWIDHKRREEVDTLAARPTPWEFSLYYDC